MKKLILVDLILLSLFLKQFRLGASTVSWSILWCCTVLSLWLVFGALGTQGLRTGRDVTSVTSHLDTHKSTTSSCLRRGVCTVCVLGLLSIRRYLF